VGLWLPALPHWISRFGALAPERFSEFGTSLEQLGWQETRRWLRLSAAFATS